jgi:hypothetical protein
VVKHAGLLRLVAVVTAFFGATTVGWSAAMSQLARDGGGAEPGVVPYVIGIGLLAAGVGLFRTVRRAR